MVLSGHLLLESVEGAAVQVHYFMTAHADQMMGVTERIYQEAVFPALGQQYLFFQLLFLEVFQNPVYCGEIQFCAQLAQPFEHFIGTEHFLLGKQQLQYLYPGRGAFQAGLADQVCRIQRLLSAVHGVPPVCPAAAGRTVPEGAAGRIRWR